MATSSQPWQTGVAVAITTAVSYVVCTLLYVLWPQEGIELLNALFHGLDFNQLGIPAPMTASMFFIPLLVLSLWGFLAGALFSWVSRFLNRSH